LIAEKGQRQRWFWQEPLPRNSGEMGGKFQNVNRTVHGTTDGLNRKNGGGGGVVQGATNGGGPWGGGEIRTDRCEKSMTRNKTPDMERKTIAKEARRGKIIERAEG